MGTQDGDRERRRERVHGCCAAESIRRVRHEVVHRRFTMPAGPSLL